MIVGSLLLILVAVGLLGLGLVRGTNAFLIGSIAASLLAAILLIVGARRSAANRSAVATGSPGGSGDPGSADTITSQSAVSTPRTSPETREPRSQAAPRSSRPGGPAGERDGALGSPTGAGATMVDEAPTQVFIPTQSRAGAAPDDEPEAPDGEEFADEDPADEPAAELVSPQDAARVAQLSTEVLVIDGRPRYHHPTCVHLLGRENEPLPVSEAVELGFTPCGLCEPDMVMLAEARRA
ncbi:hypothetical protein GCM10023322_66530 [Rugosimonospora acidiphila]|uniref:Clumping factor A n=1 Tax=Rugosimonospora acidiphila TaxID=556531 RepID=A0ABP9SKT3_9ACTN